MEFGLDQLRTVCDQVRAGCRDSSDLLQPRRRPVRRQIPLRYLVADRSEAGRIPDSSC